MVVFPIWHGEAPRIISTFLESYDFTDKSIVPFCTSASSGIGNSDANLHALAAYANWMSGRRFASGSSQSTVADWIESLDIKLAPDIQLKEETTKMYIPLNGNKLEVTLAENSSADALVEILKENDITYTANDYGGFEKVGDIGHTLPQNNTQITTEAGDVVYIPAGVKHWHGAAANSWFSHIAVECPGVNTSNEWLEPVTDEQYDFLKYNALI